MIRHLCNRIPYKEWSGVLFYTVEGSFEEGLTVYCRDFCLMDIGSATYTEFDTSPDIAGYMVDNDLIDCHMGLMHSHDTMPTFFSSTDTSTLQEEGSYKNNFVSLIVNNAGNYTAAITRHVYSEDVINSNFTYEMFGNGTVNGNETGTEKKESIEYFMMNVVKPEVKYEHNDLDERINEIRKNKSKSAVTYGNKPTWEAYAKHNESMFTDDERRAIWNSHQLDIPWKEEEFNVKPVKIDCIDKKALAVTMARLLTSSMTCNADKIDLNSWIANYDKVYTTKFDSLADYSEWLNPYLEYLLYHIPGMDNAIIDDATVAVYANAIIERIGEPRGQFSTELINELSYYGSDIIE